MYECRLVDTDCKWGLNRAGRPPDAFWERSACNPVRKLHARDSEIRCACHPSRNCNQSLGSTYGHRGSADTVGYTGPCCVKKLLDSLS